MKNIYTLLFLCFVVCVPAFSQVVEVKGYVYERETLLPIKRAIVSIRNKNNNVLYSSVTSEDGKFCMQTKGEDLSACNLQTSCMGYKSASCLMESNKLYTIELEPKTFVLKDVYVKADKVTHHNDTTSYLVSGFSTINDRTIGDVLRKMPGIDVAKNGTVSYNGKAITEFLVEGVDLFDGQYNIATRNISHDLISRVDIIEEYHSEKVLKNAKSEGGTVLNLSLKDKAKGHWSGNAKIGAGISRLWEDEFFDARLSSTNQTSIIVKTNNSGKDILSENKTLTLADYLNQNEGDEIHELLDISQTKPGNVEDERACIARTHIVNIGNVQKVSDDAILRTKIYFTDDRNISNFGNGTSYFLSDSTLRISTKENSKLRTKELAASVLFKKDDKASFFSNELKYSSLWQKNNTDISGDYSRTSEIASDIHSLTNNLKWIKPVGKHFLTIESVNKYLYIPETLCVQYEGQSLQNTNRSQFLSLTKVDYTWNLKRWAISINAEGIMNSTTLRSDFLSEYIDTVFNEKSRCGYLALVARPTLSYKVKGFRAELQVPLSYYHYLKFNSSDRLFCLPKATLRWQFDSRWRLRANLSAGSEAMHVANCYTVPIMTDYKTFTSSPIVSYASSDGDCALAVNYTDYTRMLFCNASIGFNWRGEHSCTDKEVKKNMVYYSAIKGNNKYNGTMLIGNISKRINGINGTVNAKCLYFINHSNMYQNGLPVEYNTNMVQMSIGVNSNIQNLVELDYQFRYNANSLSCSTIKVESGSLIQNLQLNLMPIKNFTLTFVAEHYVNKFSSYATKQIVFSDLKCLYKYRKMDFVCSLNNIFNQKNYNHTTYHDLSSSYNNYTLRGRNLLFGVMVYF